MIDLLKQLIQNRIPIVVFNEAEVAAHQHASIKELNLYRTTSSSVPIANQTLPAGSYVLLSHEKETNFLMLNHITRESRVGTESIRAYVVSFGSNDTRSLKLDADPNIDIVVTERLSGCTFAGEMNTSEPTVMHINKLDANGLTDQSRINRILRRADHRHDGGFFTVTKDDYNLPGQAPEGAYIRVFAATVMGFRKRLKGHDDRWEYYSQYCVYHSMQRQCIGKRGKKCEYIEIENHLEPVITNDPMDKWSDISRASYSQLRPSLERQRVNTVLFVTITLVFIAYMLKLLRDYGLQSNAAGLTNLSKKS